MKVVYILVDDFFKEAKASYNVLRESTNMCIFMFGADFNDPIALYHYLCKAKSDDIKIAVVLITKDMLTDIINASFHKIEEVDYTVYNVRPVVYSNPIDELKNQALEQAILKDNKSAASIKCAVFDCANEWTYMASTIQMIVVQEYNTIGCLGSLLFSNLVENQVFKNNNTDDNHDYRVEVSSIFDGTDECKFYFDGPDMLMPWCITNGADVVNASEYGTYAIVLDKLSCLTVRLFKL